MKYADGGGWHWITMPRNEKLHKGEWKWKEAKAKAREENKKKKKKGNRTAWQAQEKRQQQRAMGWRKEGGDSSGKTCRRTTMYNEMPTKADTSCKGRGRGKRGGSDNRRQQEHKYYKQFNIILMPCHIVLCLSLSLSRSCVCHAPSLLTRTRTLTHIYMRVYLPCK